MTCPVENVLLDAARSPSEETIAHDGHRRGSELVIATYGRRLARSPPGSLNKAKVAGKCPLIVDKSQCITPGALRARRCHSDIMTMSALRARHSQVGGHRDRPLKQAL